ncbi:MFS transporter [Caldimonas brevitalea]|uniref:MFS transporter n=1 Tax=Caldimonas brevitalea TaxID=413882 RepID=UPI00146FF279|nr:MFS transporter [Caldimonas brevitalea]
MLWSQAQFLALGLLMGCWACSLPALKQRFGYDAQQLSLVLLSLAAGSVLAFLGCARVLQAVGTAVFTRTTGVLAAYALVGTQLVSESESLALVAFVFGWASAGFDVAINATAVAIERKAGRAVMSKLHAMFSSGGVVAAGVAAPLLQQHLDPLWLAVPAALLLSALALAGPADAAGDPVPAPALGAVAGTDTRVPRSRLVWRLGAAALLCLLCEGTMYDWSAVYMTHVFAASPALAVAGFGLFSAAMAFGRFTGDTLRDRRGGAAVLGPGCWLAAAGAGLAVLAPHGGWALLGFVLVGLGLSNVIPIVFAMAGRAGPGTAEGAIAFVSGIGFVGFLVGPPLVGLWASVFSFDTALLIVLAACVGVAGLVAPARAHRGAGR